MEAFDTTTSYIGTPLNMAPQILFGQSYDNLADIWSLGTIIYEMIVGFAPFTGYSPQNLAKNVREGNYAIPKDIDISLACFEFIDKCLKADPDKRIKHDELIGHAFMQDDTFQDVIKLQASVIGDSPFQTPESVSDLNKLNSYQINVNQSCLFNEEYAKQIQKHYQNLDKIVEEEQQEEVKQDPAPVVKISVIDDIPEIDVDDSVPSDSEAISDPSFLRPS